MEGVASRAEELCLVRQESTHDRAVPCWANHCPYSDVVRVIPYQTYKAVCGIHRSAEDLCYGSLVDGQGCVHGSEKFPEM